MLSPSRYLGSSCVLVCDDSFGGSNFLTELLRAAGIRNEVRSYPRTQQVVEYLCQCLEGDPQEIPKLILLATDNPEQSGFETIEWIRSNADFDATALLLLTPVSDPEYAQCTQRMGVDALLEKYPGPSMLRIVVLRELRTRTLLAGNPEPVYAKPSKVPRWLERALRSPLSRSGA